MRLRQQFPTLQDPPELPSGVRFARAREVWKIATTINQAIP